MAHTTAFVMYHFRHAYEDVFFHDIPRANLDAETQLVSQKSFQEYIKNRLKWDRTFNPSPDARAWLVSKYIIIPPVPIYSFKDLIVKTNFHKRFR